MNDYSRPRQPVRLGQRVYGRGAFGVVTSLRPGIFGRIRVLTDGGRTIRGHAASFSVVADHVGRA